MHRISAFVAALAIVGLAACDAPSIGSPTQPSFAKGGNVAVHECHDTATTKGAGCGSVAVGGNKMPAITSFTFDSIVGADAWFTAQFTGASTGTVAVSGSCTGDYSVSVSNGPFVLVGARGGGGWVALTVTNSFGSVTSQSFYVPPFFSGCA